MKRILFTAILIAIIAVNVYSQSPAIEARLRVDAVENMIRFARKNSSWSSTGIFTAKDTLTIIGGDTTGVDSTVVYNVWTNNTIVGRVEGSGDSVNVRIYAYVGYCTTGNYRLAVTDSLTLTAEGIFVWQPTLEQAEHVLFIAVGLAGNGHTAYIRDGYFFRRRY